MKKKLPYIILFLSILWIRPLEAQQLGQHIFYQSNWQLINPAAINYVYFFEEKEKNTISASARKQWLGFPDSPTTFNVKYERIPHLRSRYNGKSDDNMKFGGFINRDQAGAISSTSIFGNYAYYINTYDDISFGLGINAGFYQYRVNLEEINFENTSGFPDEMKLNQWHADFAVGAFLVDPDNFYLGISIPQTFDIVALENVNSGMFDTKRSPHIYLIYGHIIRPGGITSSTYYEPSVLIKYVPGLVFQSIFEDFPVAVDVNFRTKTERFWGGVGLSSSKTARIDVGMFFEQENFIYNSSDKYAIGLAYGLPLWGNGITFGHTVELTFSYSWH